MKNKGIKDERIRKSVTYPILKHYHSKNEYERVKKRTYIKYREQKLLQIEVYRFDT